MKKILIVDDNPDVAETVQDIIKSFSKYSCDFVTSAENAIPTLKSEPYDLVITDLLMPGMNGIEFVDYLTANLPETKVLAYSGGGTSGALVAGIVLDQAMEEGAHNAILKPFKPEDLIAKINDLIA